MSKTIFTSLSPNAQADDIKLAFKLLFTPWQWKKGKAINKLEQEFKNYLPAKHAYSFVSGRGCLHAILSALDLKPEDEVLLQAYTCVAVPEPILWVGAKPIYVDIEANTFNMSPADLEKKITPHSKVLIIQHTFGNPAKLDELLAIAKKHNLFVIEDCAHSLGSEYHGQKTGTFGNASFFSFGRDKVISSVYGGILITNNDQIASKIGDIYQKTTYPGLFWIKQQLLHPLITGLAKYTYDFFSLGKIILFLSKKLRLTSKAVQTIEKSGGQPRFISKKLPNALAILALHQFKKLDKFNDHKIKIAKQYNPNIDQKNKHIYLRYNIKVDNPKELIQKAKQNNILLDDWYSTCIAPQGVYYDKINYKPGSCPIAEKVATQSCNLPTNIFIDQNKANKIINFLKENNVSTN